LHFGINAANAEPLKLISNGPVPKFAAPITEPNKFVAEVHDRMPVLLAEKDFEPWLSGAAGLELLKPAANDLLQRWPVSTRVNSSRAPDEDSTLIDSVSL